MDQDGTSSNSSVAFDGCRRITRSMTRSAADQVHKKSFAKRPTLSKDTPSRKRPAKRAKTASRAAGMFNSNPLARPAPITAPYPCASCGITKRPTEYHHSAPCVRSHRPTVCDVCTNARLINALAQKDVHNVCCPDCQSHWSYDYLAQIFDMEQMAAWRSIAKHHPKFRICLGPDCGHSQIHNPGLRQPRVVCERCGFETCFGHEIPWHAGQTCAQYYDAMMGTFDEHESGKEVSKKDSSTTRLEKQCPKCSQELGLNPNDEVSIKCLRCKLEFCIDCLADMSKVRVNGLHEHNEGCKYWRASGWDTTGDVKRGLEKLAYSRDVRRRFEELLSATAQNATGNELPNDIADAEEDLDGSDLEDEFAEYFWDL